MNVTNMELFFDLVYVFAVTQLSHRLLGDLTWRGAVETLILFAGVWWAWNYTAWATNWIDPDAQVVRVLLIVLMLLSLVMAASLPDAFSAAGLAFAGSYVALQCIRSIFMVWALRGTAMAGNYAQLLAWSCIAGAIWVAGALFHGDTRLGLWVVALAIEYGAPSVGYALPVVGRTPMSSWDLRAEHLAERCQLIVIVALGESILITGATFAELDRTAAVVAAFVVTFICSASLWWLYFARHADAAAERVAGSTDATRRGRGGYAYAHAVMVAGVIVTAVGFELVIAHPTGHVHDATALVVVAGPAIFNAGMAMFAHSTGGLDGFERRMVAGGFLALAIAGLLVRRTPLALETVTTAVLIGLVVLAAWHARSSGVRDAEPRGA